MADNTKIEWTDRTWNVVLGCDRVSPGCDGCYAIPQANMRAANPHPKIAAAFAGLTERTSGRLDWTGKVNQLSERLAQPLGWKKPQRVFVNSLSDLFHDKIDAAFIAGVFAVMAATPQHTYQILTKRHGRMRSLLNSVEFDLAVAEAWTRLGTTAGSLDGGDSTPPYPLPNVWLGVSVEDQQRADIRIPALLDTPAAVRWVSAEPLLGPVDLDQPRCDAHDRREIVTDSEGREWCEPCAADGFSGELSFGHWLDPLNGGINWIVAGGESGPGARPMHPDWARSLRDQCKAADVPFLFKQWGAYRWIASDRWDAETGNWVDGPAIPERVHKKLSGRKLDGRTWDEFPAVVA